MAAKRSKGGGKFWGVVLGLILVAALALAWRQRGLPIRVELVNESGGPLSEVRVEHPGGVVELGELVPPGGIASAVARYPATAEALRSGIFRFSLSVRDERGVTTISRLGHRGPGPPDAIRFLAVPSGDSFEIAVEVEDPRASVESKR